MAPAGANKGEDKSPAEVVSDLWQLVKDYAKQETIDPLKGVARFVGFGLGGAILVSLGFVFITLAVLRGLQSWDTTFLQGTYTFVPYIAAAVVDGVVIALAIRAIKKPFRAEEKTA